MAVKQKQNNTTLQKTFEKTFKNDFYTTKNDKNYLTVTRNKIKQGLQLTVVGKPRLGMLEGLNDQVGQQPSAQYTVR